MTDIEKKNGESRYETSDVNAKKIIIVGLTSAIVLALILVGLYQLFIAETEKQVYESVLKPESIPLRDLRAREEEALNSYKLLDPGKQQYQIPIARAMQLLSEEAARKNTVPSRRPA
jgi:hypothetical protein